MGLVLSAVCNSAFFVEAGLRRKKQNGSELALYKAIRHLELHIWGPEKETGQANKTSFIPYSLLCFLPSKCCVPLSHRTHAKKGTVAMCTGAASVACTVSCQVLHGGSSISEENTSQSAMEGRQVKPR